MSRITMREAVLAKYFPTPKMSSSKHVPTKTKGSTLQELYDEVNAKCIQNQDHMYNNKNAKEIESIMAQNRRLIDAKRNHRR